jgi:DNA-binding MarR family transcriptional regulator
MARAADDEVLLRLARTVVGISMRAADRLGGVSVVQLRALTVLRDFGTANLGQLSEELGVTVSTASRLVDRLVAADLVQRRPAPHSRREVELSVTGSGQAVLDRYDDLRLVDLQVCLAQLPRPQRRKVLVAFEQFTMPAAHREAGTHTETGS